MSGILGYYLKILEDTASAVNKALDRNIKSITVRKVRVCNSVPSSDRSQIVFISKALDELRRDGYLQFAGRASPKNYTILKPVEVRKYLDEKRKNHLNYVDNKR
ncbi:MAG: hypothetical protein ACTSU5_15590 [Promethearchaeota archaeon]